VLKHGRMFSGFYNGQFAQSVSQVVSEQNYLPSSKPNPFRTKQIRKKKEREREREANAEGKRTVWGWKQSVLGLG